MVSETMDDTVSKLQDKVNTITAKNGYVKDTTSVDLLKSNSHFVVMGAIPIITIVILCLMKPSFIMYKSSDNDKYYISYKRVLIVTVVLCCLLAGGIVGWKQYKK